MDKNENKTQSIYPPVNFFHLFSIIDNTVRPDRSQGDRFCLIDWNTENELYEIENQPKVTSKTSPVLARGVNIEIVKYWSQYEEQLLLVPANNYQSIIQVIHHSNITSFHLKILNIFVNLYIYIFEKNA